MAVTDLTLSISTCIDNNCSTLKVTDTTDVYNMDSNAGGWESQTTTFASNITAATVTVTPPGGSAAATDVLTNLPSTVTGDFLVASIDVSDNVDGEYKVVYTVTEGQASKTKTVCFYSLCNARCCVDAMWSRWAQGTVDTNCDCGCSESSTSLLGRAQMGEALLRSLTSNAIANDTTTRDKLLTKLQRLCDLEDCNCN